MRKLLLDTANIDEVRELIFTDAIHGVTTNPSLMAKESASKGYLGGLIDLARLVDSASSEYHKKHLSVEAVGLTKTELFDSARELHDTISKGCVNLNLFVKIPVTLENLVLITQLTNAGIQVNATACMTAKQAYLAREAGAPIVSFFYNRMIDGNTPVIPPTPGFLSGFHPRTEALEEIKKFTKLNDEYVDCMDRSCSTICGSIRRPDDVMECWEAGSEYVTASRAVIEKMMKHPKTDEALAQFQTDYDKWTAVDTSGF